MEKDTRVFEIYNNIEMKPVRFKNRYGIEVAGHLYLPENCEIEKRAAIAVSGPFSGVKEMASGLYAQELATMGFVAVAFDQSFTGESGGEIRNVGSPEIFSEDYSAAVDFLGTLSFVERNRIGIMGICGLAGMALTAAATNTRIKAVATASMYDLTRSITKGFFDSYTKEQRNKIKDFLSNQRWNDVDNGTYTYGPHEISFNANAEIQLPGDAPASDEPQEINPVVKRFIDYYYGRAMHPSAISAWTQTTPMGFFNFSLMEHVGEISPRPIMLVAGENAHSRYFTEDIYKKASEPKELVIVPDADHVDMYDNKEKIPFDKLEKFFKGNL